MEPQYSERECGEGHKVTQQIRKHEQEALWFYILMLYNVIVLSFYLNSVF